jgi:hypothetical protein
MSLTPEIELWRAVIAQAVVDALWIDPKEGQEHRENKVRERRRGACLKSRSDARRWFCEADEHFRYACDCANLAPSYVKRIVIEAIDEGARRPAILLSSALWRPVLVHEIAAEKRPPKPREQTLELPARQPARVPELTAA